MSLPLEPDRAQRRALTRAVAGFLDDFYDALDAAPVVFDGSRTPSPARLTPSAEGMSVDQVLALVEATAEAGSLQPSGGHLAYIPNGGLFSAALGGFLASGLNRYTGVGEASPGFAELELGVIRWMSRLFGLPPDTSTGILLSGGSLANLTALVAARISLLGDDFPDGTMYVTSHAHHSVSKAARFAGFSPSAIREVAVDGSLRMDPDDLEARIRADRRAGLRPFLVVASAGTTDTGAVDPLIEVGDVARGEGAWLHVDGAYGGFFQLTDRGRRILTGIERADSITLDPHKGLSIPYGVGALVVRDRADLVGMGEHRGAYLQDHATSTLDFSDLGPELTRPFRGLQVWFPLMLHGERAFSAELDRYLDLAAHARQRLETEPWVERVWPSDLSIVAFQCPDDRRARRAMAEVNATGRVFMSSTSIDRRFAIRLAILNRRTTRDHLDIAIEQLATAYARAGTA